MDNQNINNQPINVVLTNYVIENANLKVQLEALRQELEKGKEKNKKEEEGE